MPVLVVEARGDEDQLRVDGGYELGRGGGSAAVMWCGHHAAGQRSALPHQVAFGEGLDVSGEQ